MKGPLVLLVLLFAILAIGVANRPNANAPPLKADELSPKTREETAEDSCRGQGSSIRRLVAISQQTGFSTEVIEGLEFAFCVAREKAVLKEEVRRRLRPAFAEDEKEKAEQAEQEQREAKIKAQAAMPQNDPGAAALCPKPRRMTRDGCN
jgi:hypothetical protein